MKYYYTDPLAAQWMSSKFGMKFQEFIIMLRDEAFDEEMRDIFSVHCVDFIPSMGRYYIHPDSLHLLEPIIDDVISTKRHDFVRIYDIGDDGWLHYQVDTSCTSARPDQFVKIIQRNGIPFMWPEVSE